MAQRFWVVFDTVTGTGEHLVESRFQFAPGELVLTGNGARTDNEDANLQIVCRPMAAFTDAHIECGQEDPRGGWYSDSYGKIEPAPALTMSLRTSLPWSAVTLLNPYRGANIPGSELSFDGTTAVIRHFELGETRVALTMPKE